MTRKLPLSLAAAATALFWSGSAWAQTTCGVSGSAQAPGSITYDPFSPAGLQQVTVPLILTRVANGGAKTQNATLIFVQPPGSPQYRILYNGFNVLYTENATAGRPTLASQSGQIEYNYGGASADQSATLNLTITVPANTDLSAGEPIRFDILYVCNGTGGLADVTVPRRLASAVQINVNVLSALQASYVGPALDFGEVGNKTDAQVATDPGPRTGYVRVASSGPYSVRMTSQNGYRLTYPGGNPALTAQSLRYRATFVGQTRDAANAAPIERVCARAGLANSGVLLPIQTTLQDGGEGRTPSTAYRDTLTVTITPLVAPQNGTSCAP